MITRNKCEVCDNSQHTSIFNTSFFSSVMQHYLHQKYPGIYNSISLDKPLEYVMCNACEFVWQKYILNDNMMEILYSQLIGGGTHTPIKEKTTHALYTRYSNEVRHLSRLFNNKKPGNISVLDFGAGWGYWAYMALAHGFSVHTVELSKERRTYMETHGLHTHSSIKELPPQSFSFINAEQVIEHVSRPNKTVRELLRTLKPGGLLHIAVPYPYYSIHNISENTVINKTALKPLQHINSFSPSTLSRLVTAIDNSVAVLGDGHLAQQLRESPIDIEQPWRGVLQIFNRWHKYRAAYSKVTTTSQLFQKQRAT